MQPSERGDVAPFYVMRVFDAAARRRAAGLFVADFSAGQPLTPAPSAVRAAAVEALATNRIGYANALGLPVAREAIARHYRDDVGLAVEASDVAITTGSSGGFMLAFLAAFDVGDTVVMARPGYPAYRNMLAALGCDVVELPCGPQTRFQPTVAQLDALDEPPAGLIVASPANPTGTMVAADELAALARWCDEHGTRFISDEIYHGITYGEPGESAETAWRTSRNAIVVNSFSKYYSMTGWRIGWLLVPDDLTDAVERLAANFTVCPPVLSQLAAVAAFDAHDELQANVKRYRENRDLLLTGLAGVGIDRIAPPDGAFYVYADVSRWTDDSLAWSARMLDEIGVAVAPGIDFDPIDGGRFVRICFAGDGADLEHAIRLLGDWLPRQAVRA